MAIQHYDGELGKFDYDDEVFKLSPYSRFDILHYEGKETDGSKIHIPEGIINCNHMFSNCESLEIPPVIPNGVEDCNNMFWGCKSLKSSPVIPDGVKDCSNMFWNCCSLKNAPVIPDSVENCNDMFLHCESIETPPIISDGVKTCISMFSNCYSLKISPIIPDSVENCNDMFWNCKSLEIASVIPDNVKNCSGMFYGCESLKIPSEIPNSVENCNRMFMNCQSLKIAPVIPDSVKNYKYMFCDCSEEIQEVGKWNIKHRGQSYEDVINETIEKYGLSDISKGFDLSMKMGIADLGSKCKDSDSCYNQILDDVKNGFITDSKSLKQEIKAMNACIKQMKIDKRNKQVSSEFGDIESSEDIQAER